MAPPHNDDPRFRKIIDEMYGFEGGPYSFSTVRAVAANLLNDGEPDEALTYLLGAQDILFGNRSNQEGVLACDAKEFIRAIRSKIKMIVRRPEAVQKLAAAFTARLTNQLGQENMREIVRRNNNESHSEICHSHDFCDANIVMMSAWGDVFHDEPDAADEAEAQLWNDAWNMARQTWSMWEDWYRLAKGKE